MENGFFGMDFINEFTPPTKAFCKNNLYNRSLATFSDIFGGMYITVEDTAADTSNVSTSSKRSDPNEVMARLT